MFLLTLFAFPSRIYFRIKIFNFNFTFNFAHVQSLEGITSLLPNGKHVIFWDIEGCSLQEAKESSLLFQTLKEVIEHIVIIRLISKHISRFS